MSLIVENGTAMNNADSFVTLADADDFWVDRQDAAWAESLDPNKEAALRKACDYLFYAYVWRGQPKLFTQSLCWPRVGVTDQYGEAIDPDSVPVAVQRAQILLAREALSVDLLSQSSTDDILTQETVSISGAVSESRTYDRGNGRRGIDIRSFAPVDAVLSGYASAKRGNSGFQSAKLVPR
jgi:hypothetical protein